MKQKKLNEKQAENFSGRRREILRTEHRKSLNGAKDRRTARVTGVIRSYEYVVNAYGLTIKRCCASCAKKVVTDSLHLRKCSHKHKAVRPTDCCRHWLMSPFLEQLGREKGMVRDRETGKNMF